MFTNPIDLNELSPTTLQTQKTPTNYREYLKSETWIATREEALDRAEYRCQLCNGNKELEIHHRSYRFKGTPDELRDVICLCHACHDFFHKNGKLKVAE